MRVYRVRDTGERYLPHLDRHGRLVLGNPKHGSEKHHAQNKVYCESLEAAAQLVENHGFSLWMKGQVSKQVNLISPGEIIIER